MFSVFFQSVNC